MVFLSLTLVHHHLCHYYHCSFILTTQAQWTWTVKTPTVMGRHRYQCWDANSVCDVFYLLNFWQKTTDSHFWKKIKFSVRSHSKSWKWSVGAPIRMCFGASLAQDSWFFFSLMLYRKVLEKVWIWVVAGKTQESIIFLSLPVRSSVVGQDTESQESLFSHWEIQILAIRQTFYPCFTLVSHCPIW